MEVALTSSLSLIFLQVKLYHFPCPLEIITNEHKHHSVPQLKMCGLEESGGTARLVTHVKVWECNLRGHICILANSSFLVTSVKLLLGKMANSQLSFGMVPLSTGS